MRKKVIIAIVCLPVLLIAFVLIRDELQWLQFQYILEHTEWRQEFYSHDHSSETEWDTALLESIDEYLMHRLEGRRSIDYWVDYWTEQNFLNFHEFVSEMEVSRAQRGLPEIDVAEYVRKGSNFHAMKIEVTDLREMELFFDTDARVIRTFHIATVQQVFYEHPLTLTVTIYRGVEQQRVDNPARFASPHPPVTAGSEIYISRSSNIPMEIGGSYILFLACRRNYRTQLRGGANILHFSPVKLFSDTSQGDNNEEE